MKTYGKKYKQGFIIEAWENPKSFWVKSKKIERRKAKEEAAAEIAGQAKSDTQQSNSGRLP